jgi:transposase
MRYELSDGEWATIRPMLPNKARGVPRVDDRRVLNDIFWVLRSGAPWRVGVWQRATTNSPPTTSRSSSSRRYVYGCALMSPRPS